MSARLKDRQMQVPFGYTYHHPNTGWRPPKYSSFQQLVQRVHSYRKGNKGLAEKHGWSLDPAVIAEQIDYYNAKRCVDMGWVKYVSLTGSDAPPPKLPPPHEGAPGAAGANMVGGAVALLEMFGSNGKPVAPPLAEKRAQVCATCPMNDKGDWTRHFTAAGSLIIRKMLGIIKDLDLRTSNDDKLQICSVCYCPLKTKVWANLQHIRSHLKPETFNRLPEHCWIKLE